MNKKMMITTLALGTAYLLRNKESRQKLMNQFQSFAGQSNKTTTIQPTRTV